MLQIKTFPLASFSPFRESASHSSTLSHDSIVERHSTHLSTITKIHFQVFLHMSTMVLVHQVFQGYQISTLICSLVQLPCSHAPRIVLEIK